MSENANEVKVRKLTDETMSNLAEICENDESGFSQQMMAKAGEVQDAIYDAMNEAAGKVDDLVTEISELAFRHAIQDLWDHGYVVDTEQSPTVTEGECAARCAEAARRGREDVAFYIAAKVVKYANAALRDERSYREGHDYFEATVASSQYEALENVLHWLPDALGTGKLRIAKEWDEQEDVNKIMVVRDLGDKKVKIV